MGDGGQGQRWIRGRKRELAEADEKKEAGGAARQRCVGIGRRGRSAEGGEVEGSAAGRVYICHLLLLQASNALEEEEEEEEE